MGTFQGPRQGIISVIDKFVLTAKLQQPETINGLLKLMNWSRQRKGGSLSHR